MSILHIYRSEPDETTKKLAEALSDENPVEFKLYEGNADYEELVKKIFECDKVICWW